MTPALAHDHSPGDPLLLLKPRAPGVTIKTFGAPVRSRESPSSGDASSPGWRRAWWWAVSRQGFRRWFDMGGTQGKTDLHLLWRYSAIWTKA
jgi:hypothetical protein